MVTSPAVSPHTDTTLPCAWPSAITSATSRSTAVQQVGQVGHGLVSTVNRQRVLDQIVGADGQEVEILEEGAHHERGGGDFDHRPSCTGP